MKVKQKAYARAGVDIDLGNKVKATLPQLLAATHRPEVLGKVGGFGGLFALDMRKYRQPVLVSSVDGVGTKLKLAFAMDRHDTIGQDLVNHCVNDIAVLGAEPLFFLDYLGTGKLEPRVFTDIIKGFAKACAENRCALIGGETAQMPGFYQPGEYDVSGTIVGVVEKSRMLDGKAIRPGDAVIGLASSGLHTNGYSLARKIFFEKLKLKPAATCPSCATPSARNCSRCTSATARGPADAEKHVPPFGAKPGVLKGLAHITGGGFVDNIPRVLPKNCDVVIRKGTWDMLPIFQLIQRKGGVGGRAIPGLQHGHRHGPGGCPADTAPVMRTLKRAGHKSWIVGEVVQGRGVARVE